LDARWTRGGVVPCMRRIPPSPPRIHCVLRVESFLTVFAASIFGLALMAHAAFAQDASLDPFTDAKNGAKLHTASGYVCPARIGLFERDAVGEDDPAHGSDFCAYSALNGVYGTIKLVRLDGPYDARSSLAPGFVEQESVGAKRVGDGLVALAMTPQPVPVYARTYETAKLADTHYRMLFAGAQFKNWAVETTIEYADPRDTTAEDEFLHAVYAAALAEIGPTAPPQPPQKGR
jgi:hypothetical protein